MVNGSYSGKIGNWVKKASKKGVGRIYSLGGDAVNLRCSEGFYRYR